MVIDIKKKSQQLGLAVERACTCWSDWCCSIFVTFPLRRAMFSLRGPPLFVCLFFFRFWPIRTTEKTEEFRAVYLPSLFSSQFSSLGLKKPENEMGRSQWLGRKIFFMSVQCLTRGLRFGGHSYVIMTLFGGYIF